MILDFAPKQKVEKQVDKEVRKDFKYIASMRPQKGQRLFKYDVKERKISVLNDSDFAPQSIAFNTGVEMKVNRKLILDRNCLYVVALNEKNAKKKFIKLIR